MADADAIGSFRPIVVEMEGYKLRTEWSAHWVQVSITPTGGPTHYMRLPHAQFVSWATALSVAASMTGMRPA